MVFFKVSDGQVTRKFRVNPGEITYDQLLERIVALFPKALEGSQQNLHLKYRDSDGDLITISTNEEFQEALAELPKDHVWKLQIYGGKQPSARPTQRANVPSSFFFQPSRCPYGGLGGFSDPWFGLARRPSWFSNPWTTLDQEFEKLLDQHTEVLNALHNTEGSEGAEAKPASEQEGEGAVQAQQGSGDVAETSDGKMKIKNFGSWEPKEFDGPFGKGRIIGPVGYYISWGSGPEAEEKEAEGKKEAASKEGGDEATKEGGDEAAKEGGDQATKEGAGAESVETAQ